MCLVNNLCVLWSPNFWMNDLTLFSQGPTGPGIHISRRGSESLPKKKRKPLALSRKFTSECLLRRLAHTHLQKALRGSQSPKRRFLDWKTTFQNQRRFFFSSVSPPHPLPQKNTPCKMATFDVQRISHDQLRSLQKKKKGCCKAAHSLGVTCISHTPCRRHGGCFPVSGGGRSTASGSLCLSTTFSSTTQSLEAQNLPAENNVETSFTFAGDIRETIPACTRPGYLDCVAFCHEELAAVDASVNLWFFSRLVQTKREPWQSLSPKPSTNEWKTLFSSTDSQY